MTHKTFLLLPQPFVETKYSSENPPGWPAGKTAPPDQESGGVGGGVIDFHIGSVALRSGCPKAYTEPFRF